MISLQNKIIRLKKDCELEEYRIKTNDYIDVLFPLDYIKNQIVFGIKNTQTGELLGGFSLIIDGPFRTIEGLPDIEKTRALGIYGNFLCTMVEITGLWIDKSIRDEMSARLWFKMANELLSLSFKNKKYILYCYTSHKTGLEKTYNVVKSDKFYSGQTKLLAGMAEAEEENVHIAKISSVYKALFTEFGFFVKRSNMKVIKNLINF